jgi:hypothetical protein
MQHFRVKLFAETGPDFNLGDAIPVFHRWIQDRVLPELLVDVADYRHVPAGPGVVLVGHDSHYSLDLTKHRLGLLYTRRSPMNGTVAGRIQHALESAQVAGERLEQEPEFAGQLRFPGAEVEISVNDRLLAPNNEETWRVLEPDVRAALDAVAGKGVCSIERIGEPRELFTVLVRKAG